MGRSHVDKDDAGEFHRRLIAPNGKIIADSAEGYSSKPKRIERIADVRRQARAAETVED